MVAYMTCLAYPGISVPGIGLLFGFEDHLCLQEDWFGATPTSPQTAAYPIMCNKTASKNTVKETISIR